jgi:DNA-binding transcriptional MerR regulator
MRGAMDKGPEAFRTISEVAEAMDLPQHVLRFWETRFPQIKPLKRGGGRRYYRPDDVELLRAIKHLLYGEGYTIKGVQKLFKEQGRTAIMPTSAGEVLPAAASPRPSAPRQPTPPARELEAPAVDAPPPTPTAHALRPQDIQNLRDVLADLKEAERFLVQARAH